MEKYLRHEKREAHPMEKYIGRLVNHCGMRLEVVGYSRDEPAGEPLLIADASQTGGWSALEPFDIVFKDCESYWYVCIRDLID